MAAGARRLAPSLAWPAIAERYERASATTSSPTGGAVGMSDATPFRHIAAMTDRYGTFEHADHDVPHGRSTDTASTT